MILKLKHGESIQIETPDGYVLITAKQWAVKVDGWDKETRMAQFQPAEGGAIEVLLPPR